MLKQCRILPAVSRAARPVSSSSAPTGRFFYSVGAASLLEAFAPLYAERMLHFFRGDQALCDWIRNEWSPRKAARAKALREYIATTWPEFDWCAAHEQYRSAIEQNGGPGPHRATAAHEALARCVAAAQSALFYRALARWADDVVLRDMARAMAQEEALSFAYFRAAFERRARVERVGFVAAWRTALSCVRAARDTGVRLAFEAIVAQWGPNTPFPAIDYIEFAKRMKGVIERQASTRLAGARAVQALDARAPRSSRGAQAADRQVVQAGARPSRLECERVRNVRGVRLIA